MKVKVILALIIIHIYIEIYPFTGGNLDLDWPRLYLQSCHWKVDSSTVYPLDSIKAKVDFQTNWFRIYMCHMNLKRILDLFSFRTNSNRNSWIRQIRCSKQQTLAVSSVSSTCTVSANWTLCASQKQRRIWEKSMSSRMTSSTAVDQICWVIWREMWVSEELGIWLWREDLKPLNLEAQRSIPDMHLRYLWGNPVWINIQAVFPEIEHVTQWYQISTT